MILEADRALFGRIIVTASSWDLQMDEVLSHPLGALPWASAAPGGPLWKTNKASLATCLQENVAPNDAIPDNSAMVIDVVDLIQKVAGEHATFGDSYNGAFHDFERRSRHSKNGCRV